MKLYAKRIRYFDYVRILLISGIRWHFVKFPEHFLTILSAVKWNRFEKFEMFGIDFQLKIKQKISAFFEYKLIKSQ